MEKNTNTYEFITLFTEHYVIFFGLSALLCSTVGYWNELSLLKQFGLNIVVFADIDDFFLAGLKNPSIFIIAFPFFACGIAYISYLSKKLISIERELSKTENEAQKIANKAKLSFKNFKNATVIEKLLLKLFLLIKKDALVDENDLFEFESKSGEKISEIKNKILSAKKAIQIKFMGIIFLGKR